MALSLSKQKVHKFEIWDNDPILDDDGNVVIDEETGNPKISSTYICWVKFKFTFAEEFDFSITTKLIDEGKKRGDLLDGKSTAVRNKNTATMNSYAQNAHLSQLRMCLIGWGDINDEDTVVLEDDGETIKSVEPLPLRDGKGIIEHNQKLVFEYLRTRPEDWRKIETASVGISTKNYKTGVEQSTPGDGAPESV